jgi:hypothetical protein
MHLMSDPKFWFSFEEIIRLVRLVMNAKLYAYNLICGVRFQESSQCYLIMSLVCAYNGNL